MKLLKNFMLHFQVITQQHFFIDIDIYFINYKLFIEHCL